MGVANFVPDRGDIVWLTFDPQAGREQAGRRPALILSPRRYNEKSSLALACPITNRAKGYPFEVPLPNGLQITGVVLADQVKSLDWRQRSAEFVIGIGERPLGDVLDKVLLLLSP